jgi:hypothetical protein
MTTNSTMTKLLRAASAVLVLALVPGLAAAQTATAERAGDTLKLTLGSAPGTVLEMAPAAAARGPGSDVGSVALGGTLGFGAGDFTTFKLNGDLQYGVAEIAPKAFFDLAGHIGFGFGDLFVFEVVPKGRFRFALDNRLSLYGDFGIGFAIIHNSGVDVLNPFPPPIFISAGSYTDTFGIFRFGFGLQYKLTSAAILVVEPVGTNVYFGHGTAFQYSFLVGALFRV